MESNATDVSVNHTLVKKEIETEEKAWFAGRRRRRTLSLPSRLHSATLSSDKEDMNSCPLNVKVEKSENSSHKKQGESSKPIDKVIIKSEHVLPVLMYNLRSTTPIKKKQSEEPMECNKETRKWTKDERIQLVNILKNEGYDGDIKYLAAQFPGQSVDSLRYFFASLIYPKKEEWEMSLDRYIKMIKDDHGRLSFGENWPVFVAAYSKFGKHPCPSEVGGVNYGLIYQSIVFFMRGGMPKKLDERTRVKLYLVVKQLRKNLRNRCIRPTIEHSVAPKNGSMTREEKNEYLAERRSELWSEGEWSARTKALSKDIHVVREFFFSHDCFNPFTFPLDENGLLAKTLTTRTRRGTL
ncbi:uncharacterized protein LOC130694340 [Daphnia carinata]|uniref:uncharacterized protein LOC130694340 n=1 Tax=Daphnia carinata TaxID=120202 RepID=UPI00257DC745|nr:uncharacterized protein LOC130694340 [Daphnia carinata]